jgi:2-dehydropantoate 2-reductase
MTYKVCIVGAGAIGGLLGTRLARCQGLAVAALARGPTLSALRTHGWRLNSAGALLQAPASLASDDPTELGIQDLVVLTVKSQALPALAPSLRPLLAPATVVLPAMNGVPWWFATGDNALGAEPLQSIDPGGGIAAAIPLRHVLGCVVHASAATTAPGVAEHRMGRGLIIGEPSGAETARVTQLAELFTVAGFEVTRSSRIRYDAWYKLWGNATMNPLSALTGATTDRLLDDELIRAYCVTAMGEVAAVGARIGCEVRQSAEDRFAVTRKLGAFRTSMLQDVAAGRTLELDALVGAVREIGARVGVATPAIDGLFGLTRLFARVRGLYPEEAARGLAGK